MTPRAARSQTWGTSWRLLGRADGLAIAARAVQHSHLHVQGRVVLVHASAHGKTAHCAQAWRPCVSYAEPKCLASYPGSTGVGRVTLLAVTRVALQHHPPAGSGPAVSARPHPPPPTRPRRPLTLARGLPVIIETLILAPDSWCGNGRRRRSADPDGSLCPPSLLAPSFRDVSLLFLFVAAF
jgi:hypothetical protein